MRVAVTQENLNKALGVVARVAAGRVSLPILSNILITAEKNKISLAATNLEIAITHQISGKVTEEGSLTLNRWRTPEDQSRPV
jgi:DNA polymerase III subunit beta